MRTAMREVLPPGWALNLAALAVFAPQLGQWAIEYSILGSINWEEPSADIAKFSRAALVVAAAAYGAFRAIAFHPFFQIGLREWLKATPWDSTQRLPFGRVRFVWQDLVVVAVALGLSYYFVALRPISLEATLRLVYWVLVAMVSGWCVAVALSLGEHDRRMLLYVMLFGAGLILRFADLPLVVCGTLAALYVVGNVGVRRTLDQLRSEEKWRPKQWVEMSQDPEQQSGATWPYRLVGPVESSFHLPRRDGVMLSLLAGWAVFAALGRMLATLQASDAWGPAQLAERELWRQYGAVSRQGTGGITMVPLAFVVIFAVIRVFRYCSDYWSPITLWGRLWTGRWVVPGYDRVFVAPVLAVLVASLGPMLCWQAGGLPSLYQPVLIASAAGMLFCGGPSFRSWRLTGHFRMRPGWLSSSSRGHEKTIVGA